MINDRLQGSVALQILPSDTIDIPNYSEKIIESTVTSVSADELVDSNADFISSGIEVGYIVYNLTQGTIATVTQVDDANTLSLSADIFDTVSDAFAVFESNPNDGALIYVGTGGDVRVQLLGGGDVLLKNVNSGQFLPLKVTRVFATNTTATDLVAIW